MKDVSVMPERILTDLRTRYAQALVEDTLTDTPITVVQGARQVGKSTLVREVVADRDATVLSLDTQATYNAARADPDAFVRQSDGLLVIDEVQRVPELVRAMKDAVEEDRRPGRFLVTGSVDLLQLPGTRRAWPAALVCVLSTLYSFLYRRGAMKTMSYTESRARYAEVLDSVVNDREEIVITRAGHEPVVIMSLADFESLRETAYLMRSPANARRLLDAMERLEAGRGEQHDLVDAD